MLARVVARVQLVSPVFASRYNAKMIQRATSPAAIVVLAKSVVFRANGRITALVPAKGNVHLEALAAAAHVATAARLSSSAFSHVAGTTAAAKTKAMRRRSQPR